MLFRSGGLGLGLGAAAIYIAIYQRIEVLAGVELPMMFLAGQISLIIEVIYAVILFLGIYTTAAGCLYGFVSSLPVSDKNNSTYILGICFIALIAGQFGFSNLVRYLYPIQGYFGLLILASLLYTKFTLMPGRKY